jgi:DNA-binding CsgD family transcriptional regulator
VGKSTTLRSTEWRAILRLVNECRDLGDDSSVWHEHSMAELAKLTGSSYGMGGEQIDCRKLTPRVASLSIWGWQNGFVDISVFESHMQVFEEDTSYSSCLIEYLRLYNRDDGLCLARSSFIPDRDWYSCNDYQRIQVSYKSDHMLWCFRSVPASSQDLTSAIVLSRPKGDCDYSARECALVREFNEAIAPLVGGPLASYAEPSPSDLSRRERDVLGCLLEGDGDKQIAARLRLSVHTVNQYTKRIYRHFGVQGRAELLARWVRRGWGRTIGNRQ